MQRRLLPIGKIEIDKRLYPRMQEDWMTTLEYSDALKSGAEFPPIEVALLNNRFVLIDGLHRIRAYKQNKKTHITCNVYKDLEEREIYARAVKANIIHGRRLAPIEKAKAILRLKQFKYTEVEISKILAMPKANLVSFANKRVCYSPSGREILLKAPLKHLGGTSVEEDTNLENIEGVFGSKSQTSILEELIVLLENNLLNIKDIKILSRLIKIEGLIEKTLKNVDREDVENEE